tara:strand:- start:15391 stop:17115 length:1725 start_codon:yes stop_codon:yes gene_type:complete
MTNTPNFRRNTGRLATDRYDFEKHLQGTNPGADSSFVTGFRHKASHVDIDNPSLVYGAPATVEAALENIKTFIGTLSNAGQGFVTVGDGYNAWHAADGSINFDPAIPTLDTLLIPIFNAIANADGYNIPEAFQRIKYGGVVVIKAGTYVIANTIEVPPGIVIMGEGYGTKLVNITSLTIPTIGIEPTPKGTPTPLPLFKILPDLARTPNDSSVDPNRFMFSRSTKFVNLVICDNFVENPILGGNYYKLPQNKTGNTPLIKQAEGSNLELINVYMLGRVNFTSGTIVNEATRFAIQLDTTSALGTGTVLKISDSFIDGFSQPIQFSSVGGTNDYLEINNSKIRSHGYLDASGTSVSKNCVINMNDNNAILTNNYFYGNHSLCTTIAYIDAVITAPVLQSISKILIASNDFAINKTTSSAITPTVVSLNSGITTTILTRATVLAYGNTFQNTTGFQIEDSTGSLLSVNSSRVYIPISVKNKTATITTSTYTVDGTSPDYMLFADTTSTAISITLPTHDAGRKVIIKDIGFNASVNNITLVRAGSTGAIEDYSGSRIIATNGASISLMSNGTNWYIY